MARKLRVRMAAGQPSGGQQPVVTPPVNPPTPVAASATPPANPPKGGSIPKAVASVTTSTTTKVKWPWWKKLGAALLIFVITFLVVTILAMNASREAERAELLAALEAVENPAEVEPVDEEQILDGQDFLFRWVGAANRSAGGDRCP